MRTSALTGVAAAVTALAVVLSGCGSDTKTATSSSSESKSSSSKETTTSKKPTVTQTPDAAAGPNPTIADYIAENKIQETGIKMGDPNAPAVNLPVPDGWKVLPPEQAPEYAYGAIVYTGPEFEADPPNIVALMSKLDGDVDPRRSSTWHRASSTTCRTTSRATKARPARWVTTRPTSSVAPTPGTVRRASSRRRPS